MASRKRPTGSNQDDLFNPEIELLLPARLAVDGKVLGSPVRQLAVPAKRVRCRLRPLRHPPRQWSRDDPGIRRDSEDHQREDDHAIGSRSHSPLVPGATEPERTLRRSNWVKAGG